MTVVDVNDPENMRWLIASGAVWAFDGSIIQRAVDAINRGDYPVPTNVPERFAYLINTDTPPADIEPVDPTGAAIG